MQTEKVSVSQLFRTPEGRQAFQNASTAVEAGRIVRSFREAAGLSQAQLAERMGVSQARISAIELGERGEGPAFGTMKRAALACGVEWPAPVRLETSMEAVASTVVEAVSAVAGWKAGAAAAGAVTAVLSLLRQQRHDVSGGTVDADASREARPADAISGQITREVTAGVEDVLESSATELEFDAIYDGIVTEAVAFGIFVKLLSGNRSGLVHMSELANTQVAKTTDVVNVGDRVKVRVLSLNNRGNMTLSMRGINQATGADVSGVDDPRRVPERVGGDAGGVIGAAQSA